MNISRDIAVQIVEAYVKMAEDVKYRPMAPSDGFGNITVPHDELDLDAECQKYVKWWWDGEEEMQYQIGCPDYEYRQAFIYVIEAARTMCGMDIKSARALLHAAIEAMDDVG